MWQLLRILQNIFNSVFIGLRFLGYKSSWTVKRKQEKTTAEEKNEEEEDLKITDVRGASGTTVTGRGRGYQQSTRNSAAVAQQGIKATTMQEK